MKLPEKVATWQQQLAGAQTALHDLHTLDTQLRQAHVDAIKQRDFLWNAPPPLPEILQVMERVVDAAAARWVGTWDSSFLRALAPRMEARPDGSQVRQPAGALPELLSFRDMRGEVLVGLFPDLLKTRLKEILAGVAYEAGPAQADLPRLVAAADARIRDIEDRHAELVDMAAALSPPVTLTLLEPVRQRRETERIRVRREADAAERRRQLEEDINQGAEQERGQPRVTRSAYLTANRNPYRE